MNKAELMELYRLKTRSDKPRLLICWDRAKFHEARQRTGMSINEFAAELEVPRDFIASLEMAVRTDLKLSHALRIAEAIETQEYLLKSDSPPPPIAKGYFKKLREKHGLSVYGVEDNTGVDPAVIYCFERNEIKTQTLCWRRLIKYYNTLEDKPYRYEVIFGGYDNNHYNRIRELNGLMFWQVARDAGVTDKDAAAFERGDDMHLSRYALQKLLDYYDSLEQPEELPTPPEQFIEDALASNAPIHAEDQPAAGAETVQNEPPAGGVKDSAYYKQLRIFNGFLYRDVCKKTGVSSATIAAFESGSPHNYPIALVQFYNALPEIPNEYIKYTGEYCRELRFKKGIGQKRLADIANVKRAAVTYYEGTRIGVIMPKYLIDAYKQIETMPDAFDNAEQADTKQLEIQIEPNAGEEDSGNKNGGANIAEAVTAAKTADNAPFEIITETDAELLDMISKKIGTTNIELMSSLIHKGIMQTLGEMLSA